MFLNETLLVLAYTANMMATLPEEGSKNVSAIQNISTTTLSPEEEENKFDMDDRKYIGSPSENCAWFFFINGEASLRIYLSLCAKRKKKEKAVILW